MGCMSQKSPTEQEPSNGSSEQGGSPIITGPEPHCHFIPNIMKIGGGGPVPSERGSENPMINVSR